MFFRTLCGLFVKAVSETTAMSAASDKEAAIEYAHEVAREVAHQAASDVPSDATTQQEAASEYAAQSAQLMWQGGAMMKLRTYLSGNHAKVLPTWLLDELVTDKHLEERMVRICAQITAALVLHSKLAELSFIEATLSDIDLAPLVKVALEKEIVGHKEGKILMQINLEANEAKHRLVLPRPRVHHYYRQAPY
jgi:hypothetical protein